MAEVAALTLPLSPVDEAPWTPREGLMGVALNSHLFMSGGRTHHGVGFSSEVWRSSDSGASWQVRARDNWRRVEASCMGGCCCRH